MPAALMTWATWIRSAAQSTAYAATSIVSIVGTLMWSTPATAETSVTSFDQAQSVNQLSLSTGVESYLDRTSPPAGVSDYTRFSARLRASSRDDYQLRGVLDVRGSLSANIQTESSVEVPEAYFSWRRAQAARQENDSYPSRPGDMISQRTGFMVDLGRKREAWSRLDSQWGLGLWQPFNRFDGLRASEQGLAGAFVGFKGERLGIMAFASPVFLPEQGPSHSLDEGRFSTKNPWFTPPMDRYLLFSKETEAKYRIEIPEVREVISQPSVGLLVRYSESSEGGLRAQAAFSRKPRNSLSLPFSVIHVTTDSHQEGEVVVYPRVAFHRVASAEVSYRNPHGVVGLSALIDLPEAERVEPKLTSLKLSPLTLLSPSLEVSGDRSRWYLPRVRLSYLHSIGPEDEIQSPLTFARSPFSSRTLFRQAASVEMTSRWVTATKWSLEQSFKWIEEFSERGTILSGALNLDTSMDWRLSIWGDLLGSRQPLGGSEGFIGHFRGNDRVGATLTYLF